MRCHSCDYPLWKTARRACPECGAPFKPSDFPFRPAAVIFRCPHCAQPYYGTSERGHLEPPAFHCCGCGHAITMDETLVEPALNVAEADTGAPPNPWMARRELGLVRAWFRSVLRILGAPTEFIRGIPSTAPVSDAVLFAGVTATFAGLLGLAFVIAMTLLRLVAGGGSGTTMFALLQVTLTTGANILVAIVSALVAGFVAHLILVLLRGAPHGLSRSMQPILYAHGATNAITLAICSCALLISPVWWCVAMARMLRQAQGAELWKTMTASIIAAFVWFTASVSLAFLTGFIGGAGGGTLGSMSNMIFTSKDSAGIDLFGGFAPHESPVDAVIAGDVAMSTMLELIAPNGAPVTIAGLDRAALLAATPESLESVSTALAARLPPNGGPFRLGRAVFTHRDTRAMKDRWLVIVLPQTPSDPKATWTVHRANDITDIAGAEFLRRLARENSRRTQSGIPALPDPTSLPDLLEAPSGPALEPE